MLRGIIALIALFFITIIFIFTVSFYSYKRVPQNVEVPTPTITPIPTVSSFPSLTSEFKPYPSRFFIPQTRLSIETSQNWNISYRFKNYSPSYSLVEFDMLPTNVTIPKAGVRWGGMIIHIHPSASSISEWLERNLPGEKEHIIALEDRKIGGVNAYLLERKDKTLPYRYVVLLDDRSYLFDFYRDGRKGAIERIIEDIFSVIVFQ